MCLFPKTTKWAISAIGDRICLQTDVIRLQVNATNYTSGIDIGEHTIVFDDTEGFPRNKGTTIREHTP